MQKAKRREKHDVSLAEDENTEISEAASTSDRPQCIEEGAHAEPESEKTAEEESEASSAPLQDK